MFVWVPCLVVPEVTQLALYGYNEMTALAFAVGATSGGPRQRDKLDGVMSNDEGGWINLFRLREGEYRVNGWPREACSAQATDVRLVPAYSKQQVAGAAVGRSRSNSWRQQVCLDMLPYRLY